MSDMFNTGQSNVTGAYDKGQSAINSFNPNDWQQQTKQGYSDLYGNQNKTQNDYITQFKNQISSQPSASDYYNQGMDKFNVGGLQQTSNNLNNAMLNAPNSNLQAARGFNYDQNQVDQKTSQDLQRLGPAAQAAQNNATTAQGNAMNYANMGVQQNQMNLLPLQEQGQYLMDSYARQQSGFTTTQQSQLDALKQKMMTGAQLSADEMSAFSALTTAEASYQGSLATANASIEAAKLKNQYQIVPQNENLINTVTKSAINPTIANPNGMRVFQ